MSSINDFDENGDALIHQAIKNDNMESLKLLLDNPEVDLNILDANNNSPLHLTVTKRKYAMTKLLIEKPNTNLDSQNEWNETPFFLAVKNNDYEMVKCFHTKGAGNININIKDIEGYTPLNMAFLQKNINIVRLIISMDNVDLDIKPIKEIEYIPEVSYLKFISMVINIIFICLFLFYHQKEIKHYYNEFDMFLNYLYYTMVNMWNY
jgi:ankyrin repeat protein